jgi:hypothetical protein
MSELFFAIFIVSLVIYGQGLAFNRYILKCNNTSESFFQTFFFGFIFLGFNVVLINFFFPINKFIGTLILVFSILILTLEIYKIKQRKKLFKKFVILAITSFFLIAFSNVNRPDAGLYHLPYISILNENKIIFGISNLHFRFGHISIIQYISSAFNNYIIPIQSLSIPAALIFSSYIYFLFSSLKNILKKKDHKNALIFFLLIVISVYSYNRFSAYGNDTPAHIYLLLFFIYLVAKDKNEEYFPNIILISTFLLLIKPFMIILGFLIFYLFFKQKNKMNIFLNRKIIFSIFFLSLWLIKNLIVSGCLIYPISSLCKKDLIITDIKKTSLEEVSGEAWSKDWNNYKEKNYKIEDYNKKFRWTKTWYDNHFNIVVEKFSPILIFLFLIYLFLFFNKENHKKKKMLTENYFFISFFLLFVFLWFVKFPLYRYGSSFLIIFFVYCMVLITKNFDYSKKEKNIKYLFNFFLIITILSFLGKNSLRIFKDFNSANYFPQIYNLDDNSQTTTSKFEKISLNDKGFYYFSGGNLCMYSNSPCTHIELNNIVFSDSYNYKVFYKKK